MKLKRQLFVAMLALLLGQINLSASETANLVAAKANLTEQISEIVNGAPIDLLSSDSSNELTISFRINENAELTSLEVEGQNDSLTHYVKMKLEQNVISIDPVLGGLKYRIPVSYKVRLR